MENFILGILLGAVIVAAYYEFKRAGIISAAIRFIKNPKKY